MKTVIQRVAKAQVSESDEVISGIGKGFLILVGVGKEDTKKDAEFIAGKIASLRIFEDNNGKMNLDIKQAGGEILSVPQFTLLADTHKGNRPGFDRAASPAIAEVIWKELNTRLTNEGINVSEGKFGAQMLVELVNDGPVTILLDTSELHK